MRPSVRKGIGCRPRREAVAGKVACGACRQWKAFDDFEKDCRNGLGIKNRCKACQKQRYRERLTNDRAQRAINTRRLGRRLRGRVAVAMRRHLDGKADRGRCISAMRHLGCTLDELLDYLESMFDSEMTWGQYGTNGWHIDHVLPLASFDLTDPVQCRQACHYTNLQPLWAEDNLRKGSKVLE